jgi:hypothetical protein
MSQTLTSPVFAMIWWIVTIPLWVAIPLWVLSAIGRSAAEKEARLQAEQEAARALEALLHRDGAIWRRYGDARAEWAGREGRAPSISRSTPGTAGPAWPPSCIAAGHHVSDCASVLLNGTGQCSVNQLLGWRLGQSIVGLLLWHCVGPTKIDRQRRRGFIASHGGR